MEAWDDGSHYWFQGIIHTQAGSASLPLCSEENAKTRATSSGERSMGFRVALATRESARDQHAFPLFLYAWSSQVPEGGLCLIPILSAPWGPC